jgi:hypothetical protein
MREAARTAMMTAREIGSWAEMLVERGALSDISSDCG